MIIELKEFDTQVQDWVPTLTITNSIHLDVIDDKGDKVGTFYVRTAKNGLYIRTEKGDLVVKPNYSNAITIQQQKE